MVRDHAQRNKKIMSLVTHPWCQPHMQLQLRSMVDRLVPTKVTVGHRLTTTTHSKLATRTRPFPTLKSRRELGPHQPLQPSLISSWHCMILTVNKRQIYLSRRVKLSVSSKGLPARTTGGQGDAMDAKAPSLPTTLSRLSNLLSILEKRPLESPVHIIQTTKNNNPHKAQ